MRRYHFFAVRVGSESLPQIKKEKQDKIPFDATCLTCEKPNCRKGECELVCKIYIKKEKPPKRCNGLTAKKIAQLSNEQ